MDRIEEPTNEAGERGIDVHEREIPRARHVRSVHQDGNGRAHHHPAGRHASGARLLACGRAGHHYTGSDRRLHYNAADDWRAEAKARKWAHDRPPSPDAIRTAARNTDDIYEIAFTLNVSVEFYASRSIGIWRAALVAGNHAG